MAQFHHRFNIRLLLFDEFRRSGQRRLFRLPFQQGQCGGEIVLGQKGRGFLEHRVEKRLRFRGAGNGFVHHGFRFQVGRLCFLVQRGGGRATCGLLASAIRCSPGFKLRRFPGLLLSFLIRRQPCGFGGLPRNFRFSLFVFQIELLSLQLREGLFLVGTEQHGGNR